MVGKNHKHNVAQRRRRKQGLVNSTTLEERTALRLARNPLHLMEMVPGLERRRAWRLFSRFDEGLIQ